MTEETKDTYGRDEFERTLVLDSEQMEAICNEVTIGKHVGVDEALFYVLQRGFAELKRTRESALKAQEAKKLKAERDSLNVLVSQNPALASNPEFMAMLLKNLGIDVPTGQGNAVKNADAKDKKVA